jgi:hypothetical protein
MVSQRVCGTLCNRASGWPAPLRSAPGQRTCMGRLVSRLVVVHLLVRQASDMSLLKIQFGAIEGRDK